MPLDPSEALAASPNVPHDDEGPVFREPWEAQAFAMTLALHARGLFTWPEWTSVLAAEIERSQIEPGSDAEPYYRSWLKALERLIIHKGLATGAVLQRYADAWHHAASRTRHGAPIILAQNDFRE